MTGNPPVDSTDMLFTPISPPAGPFDRSMILTPQQHQGSGDYNTGHATDATFEGLPNLDQDVSLPTQMTSTETAEQAMLDALLDGFSLEVGCVAAFYLAYHVEN